MVRGFQWACRSTAAGIMMPGHAGLTGLTLAGLARFGEGEGPDSPSPGLNSAQP